MIDRTIVIKRVISKLAKESKMSIDDAWDILYENFIVKTEVVKPNFKLDATVDKEKQQLLRSIYDTAPVKQLYTYGSNKFGFKIDDLRVDVEHGNLKIQKAKEESKTSAEGQSEEEQLKSVRKDPFSIKKLQNPSEAVQLEAVRYKGGAAIRFINKPSEAVQLKAVSSGGQSVEFIENPSEKVQIEAVSNTGVAIKHLKSPSEKVQLAAVKQDGLSIKYIKKPSEKVQVEAVKNNPHAVDFIDRPFPSALNQSKTKDVDPKLLLPNTQKPHHFRQTSSQIIALVLANLKNKKTE